MKRALVLVFSTLVCYEVMALPPSQPVLKIGGGCPSGYSTSGSSYCSPSGDARFAINQLGNSCPGGYMTSGGNYCLASSDNTKTAIPKQGGSCPSGYSTSGTNYCLSSK